MQCLRHHLQPADGAPETLTGRGVCACQCRFGNVFAAAATEGLNVYVEDLDVHPSKVGDTARLVIDRAFEEAYRRRHGYVGTDHLFLSLAQKEWDTFAAIMRDVGVSPHAILQAVEEQVRQLPHGDSRDVSVEPAAKLVMKLAVHYASRAGRRTIEVADLLAAVFQDQHGAYASVLRRYGVEPGALITRLQAHADNLQMQEEWLKKRFELPPYLKQFGTNLNLLAKQDKLPPVHGRDVEIQQVLEILCHRERANSVMLIGEPGSARRLSSRAWRGASSSNRKRCLCGCATARSSVSR